MFSYVELLRKLLESHFLLHVTPTSSWILITLLGKIITILSPVLFFIFNKLPHEQHLGHLGNLGIY